ncbi:hypothetical protein ABBQ38_007493 [Trebouxia sp. C0009 RCD-2024]
MVYTMTDCTIPAWDERSSGSATNLNRLAREQQMKMAGVFELLPANLSHAVIMQGAHGHHCSFQSPFKGAVTLSRWPEV